MFDHLNQEVSKKLSEWLREKEKLVIGIDGYSASGKTMLLRSLAESNPDVLPVYMDDFIRLSSERVRLMTEVEDRSRVFETQWYRYDKLEELIRKFKEEGQGMYEVDVYDYDKNAFGPPHQFDLSKKILILEGIFLFHPELSISKMWDKKIYLDTHLEQADARREQRERERWGDKYVPETHPDSFLVPYKVAYRRYLDLYKPQDQADLVLRSG